MSYMAVNDNTCGETVSRQSALVTYELTGKCSDYPQKVQITK